MGCSLLSCAWASPQRARKWAHTYRMCTHKTKHAHTSMHTSAHTAEHLYTRQSVHTKGVRTRTHYGTCIHMPTCMCIHMHTLQNVYTCDKACTHKMCIHTHERMCIHTRRVYTRENVICVRNVHTHAKCVHTSTHYRMCTHKTKCAQTQMCPPRHTCVCICQGRKFTETPPSHAHGAPAHGLQGTVGGWPVAPVIPGTT